MADDYADDSRVFSQKRLGQTSNKEHDRDLGRRTRVLAMNNSKACPFWSTPLVGSASGSTSFVVIPNNIYVLVTEWRQELHSSKAQWLGGLVFRLSVKGLLAMSNTKAYTQYNYYQTNYGQQDQVQVCSIEVKKHISIIEHDERRFF